MHTSLYSHLLLLLPLFSIVVAENNHIEGKRQFGYGNGNPWAGRYGRVLPSSSISSIQPAVTIARPLQQGNQRLVVHTVQPTATGTSTSDLDLTEDQVVNPSVVSATALPIVNTNGKKMVQNGGPNAASGTNAASLGSPTVAPVTLDTTTGTSTGTGGHRGFAYNISSGSLAAFASLSWAHDWDYHPDQLPQGVEYVPTMWSDSSDRVSGVKAIASQSSYIMSFNEADFPSGANIPSNQVAQRYFNAMTNLATGNTKIGSPSVTSSVNAGQGLDYMVNFLNGCDALKCKVGFIDLHWYGDTAAEFTSYITQARSTLSKWSNLELWVGEFQFYTDEQNNLQQALTFLDDPSNGVARYSYFMAIEGILKSGNGLSTLGKLYA